MSWGMTVPRAGLKRVELYVQIKEEEANIRPYGRPTAHCMSRTASHYSLEK